MQQMITEYLALMLESPALAIELQKVENEFRIGTQITIQDTNGISYPLVLNNPIAVGDGYKKVTRSEPTIKPMAPYPCVFIYHINSEYTQQNQESAIRWGQHRIGISIYMGGATSEDAESAIKRVGHATKKLIERNQYAFGQIPGLSSTLAFIESEISGQHLPSIVVPYHMICVVIGRELRN